MENIILDNENTKHITSLSDMQKERHMEIEKVKKILVELYNDFQSALIEAGQKGKGNYTDEDFDSLTQFITFIRNN